ncbi:MAG: hypothetical protein WC802_01435 [Patescibacteria group bacterium]|jgi:hypothetical protein
MLNRLQSILLFTVLGVCILATIALSVALAEERKDYRDLAGNYWQLMQKEFVGKPNGSLVTNEPSQEDGVFKPTDAYEDRIWLQTIGYDVWLGSEIIGVRRSAPPADSYVKTTDSRVVAITDAAYNDFTWEESYIHLNEHKMINLEISTFGVEQTVHFKGDAYTITSNTVTDDTCEASWYDQSVETFEECDRTKPLRVTSLLVNGKTAYRVDPITLKRLGDGSEGPRMYQPTTSISMLGVGGKMDVVYFEFMGKNYSVNEAGIIQQVTLPDDLVKIIRDEEWRTDAYPEVK